jgi:hypothetical protein
MGCAAPNSMHWDDLRSKPTLSVVNLPGVNLASDGMGYEVGFLNSIYYVNPIQERIAELSPDPERLLSEEFQILLIRYLVADDGSPLDWINVSEKDFPGGVTFFQGPHALHVDPIAKLYGRDLDAFEARAKALGAITANYGDKAMCFFPFPKIPVTYVLWKEDEEFPAFVSVLFDQSITKWFAFDMIFLLVLITTQRIIEGQ